MEKRVKITSLRLKSPEKPPDGTPIRSCEVFSHPPLIVQILHNHGRKQQNQSTAKNAKDAKQDRFG
jgi:hypothetical protein